MKISGFKMTFSWGMVLVGNLTALDERVELPRETGSDEPVQLHDSIDRLLTGR